MTSALLAMTLVLGGTGTVHDSFVVNAPAERVVAWLIAHPTDAVTNSGNRVLWQKGTRICVERQLPRQTIWMVLDQLVTPHGYECKLVQGSSVVKAYNLHGTLTPVGLNQTRIDVSIVCSLDMPLAKGERIEQHLRQGVDSFKSLLIRNVR